jgi:hypothetical protein
MDEAHLLALGLVVDGQAQLARQAADLRLGHLADGESHTLQPRRLDRREEVRLVLRAVQAALQAPAAGFPFHAGVVARGHQRRAQGVGVLKEAAELDVAVAQDARVGRAAAAVLFAEPVDQALEVGGKVEHGKPDAQPRRHLPRIGRIVGRAAPLRPAARVRGPEARAQEHADRLVPGFECQVRRDGGVHAARHRHDDLLARHSRYCSRIGGRGYGPLGRGAS